jgi:hypothetical protein
LVYFFCCIKYLAARTFSASLNQFDTSTISKILPLLLPTTHARASTSLPRLRAFTSCHNIIASPQLSFFCVWVNHNFHSAQHLHEPQHSTPLAAHSSPSSFPTTTHCTPHPWFKPRSPHTHLCIPALYFLALPWINFMHFSTRLSSCQILPPLFMYQFYARLAIWF